MRMIQSPAPDNRVEFCYQFLLRVGFAVLDDGSHFLQESMHILRRRLDEKLSIGISADVESEEIKSAGYCYANYSQNTVRKNTQAHNPMSPLLFGEVGNDDVIKERDVRSCKENQLSLFDFSGQE